MKIREAGLFFRSLLKSPVRLSPEPVSLLSRHPLKGFAMRSCRLRLFVSSVFGFVACVTVVGCSSMSSNIANSSGMGYYEQGNYIAAASEFQQAAMNDPSNPDYLANFAKSKMKIGDAAGAEQLYRQALTIAPSHQPSYHGLSELMMAQGRSQEAASMLTTWSATQPYIAESHVELAWLQREMGEPHQAAQSLQQALQVNPGHSTALAHLGQYYQETGRPDQAVAMYQQSLRADWNQPEVHSRVAAASQAAGASSPMAATAMARGVHPYNMPRNEFAFGPPSPGAQMAQMQMMQTQMAMAGNPVMNGQMMPGQMTSGQMAMSPGMNPGMMSANYAPSGWQAATAPMMMSPTQTASMSFGTGASMPTMSGDASWTVESATPAGMSIEIPQGTTTEPAAKPMPDPAFSSALKSVPVTSVSWSATGTSTAPLTTASPLTSTASSEPPVVEAF